MKRIDDGSWMAEVLCSATRICAEPARDGRLKGSIYANVKAVALYWDVNTLQLKTFMNPGEFDCSEKSTVSFHMTPWLKGMSPEGQARFKDSMRTDVSSLRRASLRSQVTHHVAASRFLCSCYFLQISAYKAEFLSFA